MRKKTKKKLFAALLAVMLLGSSFTVCAAALSPAPSYNANTQNYRWYSNYSWNWADTVKSYLYENPVGGVTRVEYIDGVIVAEDYDDNFNLYASRMIPMELPVWGGFFAGEQYNFVVFGQENPAQNDGLEVVRVVKYAKDWTRLGQASLYGANTVVPFKAGSLRCAEYGDYLYIRTCHKMYASSDGLNHQANMTIAVRQSDMTLTDSYHIVMNSSVGYVSHSFNQFVLVDQNQNIVTVDHGDAYPRSIELMRYRNAKAGGDKFSGSVDRSSLLTFSGRIGDNYTGATVGGLAETANGYVTAFNYDAAGSGIRDIYIGFTNKDGLGSTITPITGQAWMSTPVLVSTGLDGGYLLWTDENGIVYYTRYADGGTIGAVGAAADAALSDCQPICHNGEVIWYATTGGAPVFYKLDAAGGLTAVPAKW